MNDPTRNQILNLLKRSEQGMSTQDLCEQLNVTTMAVHRQLAVLEGQGLVASDIVRRPRGRPVHLFRLTDLAEAAFPQSYSQLVLDLLAELKSSEGIIRVRKLFQMRFKHFVETYKEKLRNKHLPDRVENTRRILDENGYIAEYEKVNRMKYHLKLYNCPVSRVAKEHPQICSCEMSSLKELLQAKVSRDHHILTGQNYCSYIVEKKQ